MGLISRIRHPRPDITKRVQADRSGSEIAALSRHFGHELCGMIYFHNDRKVLAAAQTGRPGDTLVELSDPTVEKEPVAAARIGYMALDTLLRYQPKKVTARAQRKVTEQPVLKASGAESAKAFSQTTIAISLKTEGDTLRAEAASMLSPERRIVVSASAPLSISHAEMGALLEKLAKGAKVLQQSGLL